MEQNEKLAMFMGFKKRGSFFRSSEVKDNLLPG
jgi:hypothetical protein